MHTRARHAVRELITGMTESASQGDSSVSRSTSSNRGRLLLGMVIANRPWRLVPGLKSALVAALTTGIIATTNSTVWLLAGSLSTWRLTVATLVSIALVVGWLVVDGELWDHPEQDSAEARERARLYNTSTLVTLTVGVSICYLALYLLNLVWALFVLDPAVMGNYLRVTLGYGDLFVLAWFVASAATVGGALGSGFESDESIRAATYSKREEERRNRLARATHLGHGPRRGDPAGERAAARAQVGDERPRGPAPHPERRAEEALPDPPGRGSRRSSRRPSRRRTSGRSGRRRGGSGPSR